MLDTQNNPLLASQKMQLDLLVKAGATPVSFTLLNNWKELSPDSISAVENEDQVFILGGVVNQTESSGEFIQLNFDSLVKSSNAMELDVDTMSINPLAINGKVISVGQTSSSILFSASFSKVQAKPVESDREKVRKYFKFSFMALSNISDDVFDFFYDDAYPKLPKNRWRTYWVEGMACLIAHNIAMRNIANGLGENGEPKLEKTSKTVGKLSIGYGAKTSDAGYSDAGEYALTIYGRRFYDVRKKIITVGFVV